METITPKHSLHSYRQNEIINNAVIPFSLNCDVSELRLGAVLYQGQQGKLRVISYTSRTLKPTEKFITSIYHLLDLKWAITSI